MLANIRGMKDLKYRSFQFLKTKFTYFLPNLLNVCSPAVSEGLCAKTAESSQKNTQLRSEVASGSAANLQEIQRTEEQVELAP